MYFNVSFKLHTKTHTYTHTHTPTHTMSPQNKQQHLRISSHAITLWLRNYCAHVTKTYVLTEKRRSIEEKSKKSPHTPLLRGRYSSFTEMRGNFIVVKAWVWSPFSVLLLYIVYCGNRFNIDKIFCLNWIYTIMLISNIIPLYICYI